MLLENNQMRLAQLFWITLVSAFSIERAALSQPSSSSLEGRVGMTAHPGELNPNQSGASQFIRSNVPSKNRDHLESSANYAQPIEPLDSRLWPGNSFDQEMTTSLLKGRSKSQSIWKKIPDWRGGIWEYTQTTNTRHVRYSDGEPTGEVEPAGVYSAKSGGEVGQQRDRNGKLWRNFRPGHWDHVDLNDTSVFMYTEDEAPGPKDYPDMYSEAIEFRVDKLTKKIKAVTQRKAYTRCTSLGSDLIQVETFATHYDKKGDPTNSYWNTTISRRISPDSEEPSLRADFVNYLTANGLQKLIPTDYLK